MTSTENLAWVETQTSSHLSIFDLKLKQKYTFQILFYCQNYIGEEFFHEGASEYIHHDIGGLFFFGMWESSRLYPEVVI